MIILLIGVIIYLALGMLWSLKYYTKYLETEHKRNWHFTKRSLVLHLIYQGILWPYSIYYFYNN